ncbi:MAG: myo-inosose-2 dehydratase [Pseudomonadota bacterium]|nr:myo-inosose-2 dehydratase [Pseudomonadota bacterium]
MSNFDVRIGINPISWSNDDLPELGGETPLETALSEGAEIGYAGFELGNKFPKEPEALRAKLAEYGVACVSGWYSGRLAEGSVEAEIAGVQSHVKKLVHNGCQVMVYGEVASSIQGDRSQALSRRPRFASAALWEAYGRRLTEFGTWLKSQGITLAYHHHMGAYCETPQDTDTLMAVTGPEVGLLFDTGHMTFAGGDPLTELRKHVARVVHVHCKDVRAAVMQQARNQGWSFLDSVINGVFTVPGDGMIAFAPILQTLADHGYRGWLVVEAEQDPAVAPSYEYARMGYQHLRGLVDAIDARGAAAR